MSSRKSTEDAETLSTKIASTTTPSKYSLFKSAADQNTRNSQGKTDQITRNDTISITEPGSADYPRRPETNNRSSLTGQLSTKILKVATSYNETLNNSKNGESTHHFRDRSSDSTLMSPSIADSNHPSPLKAARHLKPHRNLSVRAFVEDSENTRSSRRQSNNLKEKFKESLQNKLNSEDFKAPKEEKVQLHQIITRENSKQGVRRSTTGLEEIQALYPNTKMANTTLPSQTMKDTSIDDKAEVEALNRWKKDHFLQNSKVCIMRFHLIDTCN